jgi:integrase/recombinase XerD
MSGEYLATTDSYAVPNEYAQRYLAQQAGVTLTQESVDTYESHLRQFVQFLHTRGKSVLEIDFEAIRRFIEWCVRRGNRQSTIEGKVTAIGELYRYIQLRTDASDELVLDPLKFRDVDFTQYNTPPTIEREALSRAELRKLFDAFDSYRNRLMAIVGIETGARNSDIRNLRIENVSISDKEIEIHDPKGGVPYTIPISSDLAFELEMWITRHRPGYVTNSDSPYVFLSQHGGKLEANGSLNAIIREAAERAGIQEIIGKSRINHREVDRCEAEVETREWARVTVHTFRHSYITLLKESGVGIRYRQLMANHANAETTRGYTHGEQEAFHMIRDRYEPPR